jgi:hypothetical protein
MDVTLLYFDDCPNWRSTHELLMGLATRFPITISTRRVVSDEEAASIGFRGSPTVLIDGVDPFAQPEAPTGLSCRIYWTPDGVMTGAPTEGMLRTALAR